MKTRPGEGDIQYLKGVGPVRAALLAKLDLFRIEDLLFYFPRAWQDRRLKKEKSSSLLQSADVFLGTVLESSELYTSTSLRIFKAVLAEGQLRLEGAFFKRHNRRFDVFSGLKKDFKKGERIWLVGKLEDDFFSPKMRVEEYYLSRDLSAELKHINRIVPVYPVTEGLTQKFMRETVFRALSGRPASARGFLPGNLEKKRSLPGREESLKRIHFPGNVSELEGARKRFVYEELFLLALAWAVKKRQSREISKDFGYRVKKTLLTPFRENLGFEFTGAQKKAINEIFSDMLAAKPMARLLQGDVGSGKTVAALSACLLAAENGRQCAFMAPTEILAGQHFFTFKKFLKGLPVRFELLTSGTPAKKKKEILGKAAKGEIDILIGTHSLIEGAVSFKNLSLIVIDEQHRFGVRQRAALRRKGEKADMLIMTATPIPRTLFLSLYGDLDLSTLDEMPPGRKPVETARVPEKEAFEKTAGYLSRGLKAYMVYPVIEESSAELKSVKEEYEKIRDRFGGIPVYMMHGKMKAAEKQRTMEAFSSPGPGALVATQVIEVGIDVPEACVMVIQNAERFGLASLHQLRGRVGRGEHESACFLVSENPGEEALERIKAMCSTNSGFELSEKDAYLRGIGEILGVRQHGDMEFRIASLYEDREIFAQALADRDELLKRDPFLSLPENGELKKELFEIYGTRWNIIDLN
ncbi:MAG: ATP-dependent DNA helicase RecG [Elusimicrobia bacterium CG08_land_8_20_14_0_20_51_18]|nr:MAG: ATP-dependent DNA helicase RecG [Elusimicrobia bacterium CG08_land_8_20_14_0_20_51_18]